MFKAGIVLTPPLRSNAMC